MRYMLSVLLFLSVLKAGVTSIENNASEAITDRACINKTFDMTTSAIITDIIIAMNIDHTYRADLDITLTSPQGTAVDLTSDNGGSSDNLYVTFTDDAVTSIVDDNANHTVMVERRPEFPLSAFDGEDAQGIWTLEICDDANRDTGTYNYARLDINDTVVPLDKGLEVDYHMDECYWLDSAGGVISDVKDSSVNQYDATSSGVAAIITNAGVPPLCNYGNFTAQPDLVDTDDGTAGNTTGGISVSVWLKPSAMTNWQAIVTKSKAYSWNDGWGLTHYSGDADTDIRFFINDYSANSISATLTLNSWNHVVATYDNRTMRLYVNGTEVSSLAYSALITNSANTDPIRIAYDDANDDEYIGGVDELKVWGKALTALEVSNIYNNELAGNNFDGVPRTCPTCGTSIAANTWEMIGIPAQSSTGTITVQDVFSDDFVGANYDVGDVDGWILWKRVYHTTDNLSDWVKVDYANNEVLDFGRGYWLGSTLDVNWSVNGLEGVDYNSSYSGTADCVANSCVEIDLKSVSTDGTDGSGPHRYNLSGFIGKTPVNWADCRFIVSDVNGSNVEVLTPEEAEIAGYASSTISLWAGGAGSGTGGQVVSTDYTECTDTTPGGCKLMPYHGLWIKVFVPTLNKTVKLLIPQE